MLLLCLPNLSDHGYCERLLTSSRFWAEHEATRSVSAGKCIMAWCTQDGVTESSTSGGAYLELLGSLRQVETKFSRNLSQGATDVGRGQQVSSSSASHKQQQQHTPKAAGRAPTAIDRDLSTSHKSWPRAYALLISMTSSRQQVSSSSVKISHWSECLTNCC